MLTAYFDESGTEQRSPYYVVAGYVGKDEQWARFSDEWRGVLSRYGIDFFHMTDFENRQKQFRSLKKDERQCMLNSLTTFMRLRTLAAFPGVVLKSDYDEAIPAAHREEIGRPYHICASICMKSLGQWAEKHGHQEPITYVFEKGAEHSGDVLEAHTKALKDPKMRSKFRLGELRFADKREAIPLQAADILAYEVWKDTCNKASGSPRSERWPLHRLSGSVIAIMQADKQSLLDLVNRRYPK